MGMFIINTLEDKVKISDVLDSILKPGTVLEGPENGKKYIIAEHNPEKIKLVITSWKLRGGVHYNCRIIYSPVCVTTEDSCFVGGYLGGLNINTDVEINLERFVTQEDLDDKNVDWDSYHVGGSTSRFDDLESLFHALDLFIKKHFPDKKLEYEYDTYNSVTTLKPVVEEDLDG